MKTRLLGRTGWHVSELGFGGRSLGGGWGKRDDQEAARALHRFFDAGGNFVDTAPTYGDGHSESLIGKVVQQRRSRNPTEKIYLATKIPPKTMRWPLRSNVPIQESFPRHWIVQSTEASLKRLGAETIDLVQLDAWTDAYTDELDWYETIVRLRDQGKVRAVGISLNDYDPDSGVRLAQSGRVDSIQVIHNIFEQNAAARLFPAAEANQVAILARLPLFEGVLTGTLTPETEFDADDGRREFLTRERLAAAQPRLEHLRELLDDATPSLALLALRFCLHSAPVCSVLTGMRCCAHVDCNLRAPTAPLSPAVYEALEKQRWAHGWNLS